MARGEARDFGVLDVLYGVRTAQKLVQDYRQDYEGDGYHRVFSVSVESV